MEEAIQRWKQWVPMDAELHSVYQKFQLCMLQKLDELLQQAEIPYWICGGALMGAIRHGGFIPHDDDIDIECYQEDLLRLAELPLDPPLFTGLVENGGEWKGHPTSKLLFLDGLLAIDVFPRPSSLPAGDPDFPSQEEVFPLTRYPFCNISVWGPNRETCSSYLDRCYGKDWRDTVCVYNHDYNMFHLASHDPRKEVLTLSEYNRIVHAAGFKLPQAQGNAKATWDHILSEQDWDTFVKQYKSYRFQRTIRWNQAAAEYREKLQEEREADSTS
jgi:LicD family